MTLFLYCEYILFCPPDLEMLSVLPGRSNPWSLWTHSPLWQTCTVKQCKYMYIFSCTRCILLKWLCKIQYVGKLKAYCIWFDNEHHPPFSYRTAFHLTPWWNDTVFVQVLCSKGIYISRDNWKSMYLFSEKLLKTSFKVKNSF